ncbi:hypothetical protein AAG906_011674 [Vitis piasezkii]
MNEAMAPFIPQFPLQLLIRERDPSSRIRTQCGGEVATMGGGGAISMSVLISPDCLRKCSCPAFADLDTEEKVWLERSDGALPQSKAYAQCELFLRKAPFSHYWSLKETMPILRVGKEKYKITWEAHKMEAYFPICGLLDF